METKPLRLCLQPLLSGLSRPQLVFPSLSLPLHSGNASIMASDLVNCIKEFGPSVLELYLSLFGLF